MSPSVSTERLAPTEELLAGAASLCSLPDGVVICDRSDTVRFINPAAARLLGVDADGVLGTNAADMPGGDLREGIWPSDLTATVEKVLELKGVRIAGVGPNLGCFGAIMPTEEPATSTLPAAPAPVATSPLLATMAPNGASNAPRIRLRRRAVIAARKDTTR